MKKILLILPRLPFPLNSGGSIGVYHMINAIKGIYDVHIWYLSDFAVNKNIEEQFLQSVDYKCHIHHTIKQKGINLPTMRGVCYKLNRLLLKKDVQFQHNEKIWGKETSSRFDNYVLEDINRIIEIENIDVVQIEFYELLDYVYAIPSNVKKVFVHHELSFARKRTLMNNINEKVAYDDFMYNRMLDREISALNRYDIVIALTEIDKIKLKRFGVNVNIQVSPLFIPLTNSNYIEFKSTTKRLTFVANGHHYPNAEGLNWFMQSVHPYLITKLDYTLDVIGTGWDNSIIRRAPSNVNFRGFVRNLSDIVPGSIMIVPILSGSGMRMKILESVNNSVPFVTTTVGVEGLDFTKGLNCFIEDDAKSFAEKIETLLIDGSLQEKFVKEGRKVYEKLYSEDSLSKKRIEILNTLVINE